MSKKYKQYSVVLNNSHLVAGAKNSTLRYNFESAQKFENAQISLNTLNVYFSWFNISSNLNNNKFSYKWFDSNGILNQVFDIEIRDGYYSVNNLNEYVQSILVSRGHYLQQVSSGNYVYHIEFTSNPVYYTIELNTYAMRTASVDFVRGSTDWAFPAAYTTVQVIINSTNQFGKLIGFASGVYPTISDNQNKVHVSSFSPIMDPISSILMLCSFATQGGFSNPDNIIYSFTTGSSGFGDMIEKTPVSENYVNIRDGIYSNFTIDLVDQAYNKIDIRDPSILVMVNFRIEVKEK